MAVQTADKIKSLAQTVAEAKKQKHISDVQVSNHVYKQQMDTIEERINKLIYENETFMPVYELKVDDMVLSRKVLNALKEFGYKVTEPTVEGDNVFEISWRHPFNRA